MTNKERIISLIEFKESTTTSLKPATLCFLLRENEILLAMKKRGFAQGKWNGVGGKVDKKDDSIKSAAIRETQEEIGVSPISIKHTGTLNFYHLHNQADFGMQATVYVCDQWEGEPVETEEMAPK